MYLMFISKKNWDKAQQCTTTALCPNFFETDVMSKNHTKQQSQKKTVDETALRIS